MKLGDVKNLAILAAVGGAGFAIYKWLNKVPDALAKTGEAVGGAVFELFHPNPTGSTHYYIVKFAGGEQHAIPEKSNQEPGGVDSSGLFTFRGKRFRMKIKKLSSGVIEYWAFDP